MITFLYAINLMLILNDYIFICYLFFILDEGLAT